MHAPVQWQPSRSDIWRGTRDDFAWMIDIAQQSYGDFDVPSSLHWGEYALEHPDRILFLRSADYGIVISLETAFWSPNARQAKLLLFASDKRNTRRSPMGAARLLKEAMAWARYRQATSFWIQGIANADLEPLARLCGASERGQIFVVPLVENMPRYG